MRLTLLGLLSLFLMGTTHFLPTEMGIPTVQAAEPDADGDGVEDGMDTCPDTPVAETADANGCGPSQLDSDTDGVMDNADMCPGTPAGDTVDNDGCSLSQLDGDSDGMPDNWEDLYPGLDKTVDDSAGDIDGDDLSNLGEYQNGTTPTDDDSDDDGMKDGWEVANSLDPNQNDAAQDADGDEVSNYQEYLDGTDPQDSTDFVPPPLSQITGAAITSLPGYAVGIQGAAVSLKGTDYTTATAQDGSFSLADVTSGTYALTIIAANFETHTQEVFVTGSNVDLSTIELELDLRECDIDGDGKIGLEEAIHALQVASGMPSLFIAEGKMNLAILLVDYETYAFQGGNISYYKPCSSCDGGGLPLETSYLPPSDFGSMAFIYTETGETVFGATIVWMGIGAIQYPSAFLGPDRFSVRAVNVELPSDAEYYDWEGNIWTPDSATLAQTSEAWETVRSLDVVHAFADRPYKVGFYLYPPTVGMFDPSVAQWVIFLAQEN